MPSSRRSSFFLFSLFWVWVFTLAISIPCRCFSFSTLPLLLPNLPGFLLCLLLGSVSLSLVAVASSAEFNRGRVRTKTQTQSQTQTRHTKGTQISRSTYTLKHRSQSLNSYAGGAIEGASELVLLLPNPDPGSSERIKLIPASSSCCRLTP